MKITMLAVDPVTVNIREHNTVYLEVFIYLFLDLNIQAIIGPVGTVANMCPCSTKAVISNTGIFVAIAKKSYGSKLSIFLYAKNH